MAFLLLYIAFKLSNEPVDKILKFFLILLVAGLFLLMAKGTLDNRERCFPVVNSSTAVTSTVTQFQYVKYCYDETPATPLILYIWVLWIVRGLSVLFLVYISYRFLKYMTENILPKRRK